MDAARSFPRVAVGAVIFKDDKVLLVKRSNPPAKGLWAIPGGKVLPGESLHDALKREIKEETGFRINVGDVVYVFDVIEKNQDEIAFHYVIIDFICEYISGSLKAGDDAAEVRWISKDNLKKLNVSEKTRELLTQKFNFS